MKALMIKDLAAAKQLDAADMSAIHGAIRRMVATVEEITDAAQLQMGQPLSLNIDLVDVGELVNLLIG